MKKIVLLMCFLGSLSIFNSQGSELLTDEEYSELRTHIMSNYTQAPSQAIAQVNVFLTEYKSRFTPEQHLKMQYTKAYFEIEDERFEAVYNTLTFCKKLSDALKKT